MGRPGSHQHGDVAHAGLVMMTALALLVGAVVLGITFAVIEVGQVPYDK